MVAALSNEDLGMVKKIEHYPELVDPQVRPRYSGIPAFFRLSHTERLNEVDIGIIDVPFDGGVTNRPGARHGPRDIRNQSSPRVRRRGAYGRWWQYSAGQWQGS